jgi:hypothetical protein
MECLVEFQINVLDGTAEPEVRGRKNAEATAAAAGH